jgi:hypothetical protein
LRVAFLVLQDDDSLGGQGGEETFPSPCLFFSSGGALKDAPPLFIRVQKVSLHCKGFIGVCFVIFKVFDVIFV